MALFLHPFFYPIFFLLHLNLSYMKRIVLLVPVENIKSGSGSGSGSGANATLFTMIIVFDTNSAMVDMCVEPK